jgi:hypothetical protein
MDNFYVILIHYEQTHAVLWSRSRKEPELLAGAEAGAGTLKLRLRLQVKQN